MKTLKEKLNAKLSKNGGFTLIEMLIVVAIIAILIAVSIPLVNGALEKARDATDQANERAAKAEAVLAIMEVADLPTGASWSSDKVTVYYNAKEGSLVNEKPKTGYGKCTCSTLAYDSLATRDIDLTSNEDAVLELALDKGTGTVTMKWVAKGT